MFFVLDIYVHMYMQWIDKYGEGLNSQEEDKAECKWFFVLDIYIQKVRWPAENKA